MEVGTVMGDSNGLNFSLSGMAPSSVCRWAYLLHQPIILDRTYVVRERAACLLTMCQYVAVPH